MFDLFELRSLTEHSLETVSCRKYHDFSVRISMRTANKVYEMFIIALGGTVGVLSQSRKCLVRTFIQNIRETVQIK